MKTFAKFLFIVIIFVVLAFTHFQSQISKESDAEKDKELRKKADSLAHEFILIDTHIDAPDLLHETMTDISVRSSHGEFDYPRARVGGLDAAFMSIYTSSGAAARGESKKLAEELIDIVYDLAKKFPDKYEIAVSPQDVIEQFKNKRISLAVGMENGSPIGDDLSNVKHFFDRGVRYITLTHYRDNLICDSANDPDKKWNGLSPFGKEAYLSKIKINKKKNPSDKDGKFELIKINQPNFKEGFIGKHNTFQPDIKLFG